MRLDGEGLTCARTAACRHKQTAYQIEVPNKLAWMVSIHHLHCNSNHWQLTYLERQLFILNMHAKHCRHRNVAPSSFPCSFTFETQVEVPAYLWYFSWCIMGTEASCIQSGSTKAGQLLGWCGWLP